MRIRHRTAILSGFKRPKCTACKCDDKFSFYVPDDVWKTIVPRQFQSKVICLPCFDEFARARNVDYSECIEVLYFAGTQASFKFQTVSAQSA